MTDDESSEDSSGEGGIDGDTLLNTTVNVVPMGVLLFFVVLFAVFRPWPPNPWLFAWEHVLTLVPLVLLGLLTLLSATVFSGHAADLEDRGRDSGHRGE